SLQLSMIDRIPSAPHRCNAKKICLPISALMLDDLAIRKERHRQITCSGSDAEGQAMSYYRGLKRSAMASESPRRTWPNSLGNRMSWPTENLSIRVTAVPVLSLACRIRQASPPGLWPALYRLRCVTQREADQEPRRTSGP